MRSLEIARTRRRICLPRGLRAEEAESAEVSRRDAEGQRTQWHRFRGDPGARGSPLTRAQLIAKALPIEKRLFCARGAVSRWGERRRPQPGLCLFVHNQHFFTFVHEEGVAPTNNSAECALRTAVQWRKIMIGTRSAQGERAVERLLTVVRTCQLQQLNALAYLTVAIATHRRRQPVASLLKPTDTS